MDTIYAVFDLYGYVSLWSPTEYKNSYGHWISDLRPPYRVFTDVAEAKKFRTAENAKVRQRLSQS